MPKSKTMPNYLEDLTIRLAHGMAGVDPAERLKHAAYLKEAQRADGGFAGREGESDLYYTSFGLRGLSLVGELYGEPAERAAEFLRGRLASEAPIVDFLSLMYAGMLLKLAAGVDVFNKAAKKWPDKVAAYLETLRRPDGGYAKGAEGSKSSTYHTFLVLLCLELLEIPAENPQGIVEFLHAQRRDDGGFVEIAPVKRSGANPTAAAIGALKILDSLDEETATAASDFLLELFTDEGGIRANSRIPIADLLSTFTGLLTLQDLGAKAEIDRQAALAFAQQQSLPQGGFRGAEWDDGHDVEYTFYGLGTLALVSR
jgi:geranylgeranyl transferase type-2 subunit beta